jgi:hypothetical protein
MVFKIDEQIFCAYISRQTNARYFSVNPEVKNVTFISDSAASQFKPWAGSPIGQVDSKHSDICGP